MTSASEKKEAPLLPAPTPTPKGLSTSSTLNSPLNFLEPSPNFKAALMAAEYREPSHSENLPDDSFSLSPAAQAALESKIETNVRNKFRHEFEEFQRKILSGLTQINPSTAPHLQTPALGPQSPNHANQPLPLPQANPFAFHSTNPSSNSPIVSTIGKSLESALLKRVPVFSLALGYSDPSHAKNFLFKVHQISTKLGYSEEQTCALIAGKLDENDPVTINWNISLGDKEPKTLAEWTNLLYNTCHITAKEKQFQNQLFSVKQNALSFEAFHAQFVTLMRQGGVTDGSTFATLFVQALKQADRQLLQGDHDFRVASRSNLLTVELILTIMLPILQYKVHPPIQHVSPSPQQNSPLKGRIRMVDGERLAQPQISLETLQEKLQKYRTATPAERAKNRGKCFVCLTSGCHSDLHLPTHLRGKAGNSTNSPTINQLQSRQPADSSDDSDRYDSVSTTLLTTTPPIAAPSTEAATVQVVRSNKSDSSQPISLDICPSTPIDSPVQVPLVNNLPSNLLLNPQVGDPLAFHSATHFTTIATLTSSTGTSFRIAACADTGASLNCIDMKTVLRLKLPIKTMDSPITVTFANQSTQQLTQVVDVLICIGSGLHAYQEVHAFAICPIGDQLLLGSPWWDGIRATIDSCRQFFMFQRTIEPPSTPMKHKFTFATPQEIIMLGRQLPTLSPIRKISSKQVDKLARKRNNTICYVDLKEGSTVWANS